MGSTLTLPSKHSLVSAFQVRQFEVCLRHIRDKRGVSRSRLGYATGVSRQAINLIECGKVHPRIDTLVCLMHQLNVSFELFPDGFIVMTDLEDGERLAARP